MDNLIKSALSYPIYDYSPNEPCLTSVIWSPDRLVSFINRHLIDFCEEQYGGTGFAIASVVGTALKIVGLLGTFAFAVILSPLWISAACNSCSEENEVNLNPNDYENSIFRVFKNGEEVLSIEVIN